MKRRLATIIFMTIALSLASKQDTLKKNRVHLITYPSNLLAGDISIGLEHLYKKRISHELMFFFKMFSPNIGNYKYDKGVRLNYLVKYNFINRKYFRLSGNVSFDYKNSYFHNKEDYWREQLSTDYGQLTTISFLMDREVKAYGVGIGLTFNFRINNKLSVGTDLIFEFLNTQHSYSVKSTIKGDINDYNWLTVPTDYTSRYYSSCSLFPTFKVSYQLL